jgi:hypothetical protein
LLQHPALQTTFSNNMIKYFTSIALFFLQFQVFSQSIALDIHRKSLSDFIKMEKDLGSHPIANTSIYMSENDIAQPIRFRRKENDMPDLIVYYFFYKSDSAVNHILYEWDESNFTGDIEIKTKKSPNEITPFINKYKQILSQITLAFGESKSEGNMNTSMIEFDQFEINKQDKWKTNDSTDIDLYMSLSNKYEKKGAMEIIPTYRIRLDVANIRTTSENNESSKLTEQTIAILDSVFKSFLADLKNNDFANTKLKLSSTLEGKVTAAQLTALKNSLKTDYRLIVYLSGILTSLDGSKNTMLQYQYENDGNSPPVDLIKVVFDNDNRILVIQPTKRQLLNR